MFAAGYGRVYWYICQEFIYPLGVLGEWMRWESVGIRSICWQIEETTCQSDRNLRKHRTASLTKIWIRTLLGFVLITSFQGRIGYWRCVEVSALVLFSYLCTVRGPSIRRVDQRRRCNLNRIILCLPSYLSSRCIPELSPWRLSMMILGDTYRIGC